MSDSNLSLDSRTPEQAAADKTRKDRTGWYPGHASKAGAFVILSALDGRIVATCAKKADRDFILDAVRKAVTP